MLKYRAQAAVKAFSKKSEQPQLDEKAGMPVPVPAPTLAAEIPPPETGAKAESADTDDKPKFTIRALFTPKKKTAEAPASGGAVKSSDPFAAQTQEVNLGETLNDRAAVEATVESKPDVAPAEPATEEGEKKGLSRLFSLKRKRAVDSAIPSTAESEPKAEAEASAPATGEATSTEGAETSEALASEAPTETESKRASWKRLRLSHTTSDGPKDETETKLARTQSPIIETTADALGAVNAQPVEDKKEKKFWAFGRKDEVAEPETLSSDEAAADTPVVVEATKTKVDPAAAKSTVWKRFMSISKLPEPEPKKEDNAENVTETASPAPATATDVTTDTDAPAEVPIILETPAAEKKGFVVAFGRKASKTEAADEPAEGTAEDEGPSPTPAAQSETPEKRSSIYHLFSGRRKPTTEVAKPGPAADEATEVEDGKVEELKDRSIAPAVQTSEAGARGLYRVFLAPRKSLKAEPSVPSVQAEPIAAEATEAVKEECNCPNPKAEATAESFPTGIFRIFSGRKASVDATAENPKAEAGAPLTAEPATEPATDVLNEERTETQKEETPKVWKRLLSARKKPTASPIVDTPAPDVEPALVAETTPAPADEAKEEKISFVNRLRSFVPSKEKEAAVENPAMETTDEPVEKVEKPGVIARVTSALSLTRVKATAPPETPSTAGDATSAGAAAKPAEETVAVAAEPAAPVTTEASAPADAPKA
ncbi:hypothetical protein CspeluHIS016_0209550 [Cutaneotrichosporon spelunceum]|uniref:Uncharacterized protein n=1 Tax=Cutaneotrichosporon spelunceum TaxID=1672016 RepID=A0AAD3YBL1_9TREE|nr:hypothetical protein CspeluHIS016_0209550 [Cutaneotrichosporon spelunceum]